MYRLPQYDESSLEVLHALIAANPFATLLATDGAEIIANHVPVLIRATVSPAGLLVGHVARQNPVWRCVKAGARSLLIFQGADHYISPRWYRPGKADGKAVPTWDYAVVHARGSIEWIEDKRWLMELLGDMANAFERSAKPWRIEDMPADYRESMLDQIVGFQIPIVALQGKFKLNQSSSAEDRAALVAELETLGTDSAKAMAAAISLATREE